MVRDFKGIWIPKEIWLSKELTIMEKLLLVEIDSLDNEDGCIASNKYFAEFFYLSNNRISEIITSLKNKNIINIEYEKEGKQIIKRKINVVGKSNTLFGKSIKGIRKTDEGYSENLEDNNTIINNTFTNNKYNIVPFEEIINYLNEKAGVNYKSSTNKNKELITARWNENFRLNDFKKVIDKKVKEWTGTDFEKFLRPSTLFGTKFESYLNQKDDKQFNQQNRKAPIMESSKRQYDVDELEKSLLGRG